MEKQSSGVQVEEPDSKSATSVCNMKYFFCSGPALNVESLDFDYTKGTRLLEALEMNEYKLPIGNICMIYDKKAFFGGLQKGPQSLSYYSLENMGAGTPLLEYGLHLQVLF